MRICISDTWSTVKSKQLGLLFFYVVVVDNDVVFIFPFLCLKFLINLKDLTPCHETKILTQEGDIETSYLQSSYGAINLFK